MTAKYFDTEKDAREFFGEGYTDTIIWECDCCHTFSVCDGYLDGGITYTGGCQLTSPTNPKVEKMDVVCLACEEEHAITQI